MSAMEVLDGSTGSSLKLLLKSIRSRLKARAMPIYLKDGLAIVGGLWVDNDLQLHAFAFHDTFES